MELTHKGGEKEQDGPKGSLRAGRHADGSMGMNWDRLPQLLIFTSGPSRV